MSNYQLVHLPKPENTVEYFEQIKLISEKFWKQIKLDRTLFAFQIQPNSKWKKGLTEEELNQFENEMGFKFPVALRTFYKCMNGLDKKAINIYGDSGEPSEYSPVFYSYPDDLELIKEKIDTIYKANKTDLIKLAKAKASRIFPIYGHRFMLIDEPGQPILSMMNRDIIFYVETLSKLLAIEIFPDIENAHNFLIHIEHKEQARFWLK